MRARLLLIARRKKILELGERWVASRLSLGTFYPGSGVSFNSKVTPQFGLAIAVNLLG
jgi:hypothetical protein